MENKDIIKRIESIQNKAWYKKSASAYSKALFNGMDEFRMELINSSGSLHPVIESQASIVDLWAARERNGHILLWNKKPYGTDEGNYYHKDGYIRMLDYDIMKEIESKLKTLKNGDKPLKISLVIGIN